MTVSDMILGRWLGAAALWFRAVQIRRLVDFVGLILLDKMMSRPIMGNQFEPWGSECSVVHSKRG
jgi:hypothetical protein